MDSWTAEDGRGRDEEGAVRACSVLYWLVKQSITVALTATHAKKMTDQPSRKSDRNLTPPTGNNNSNDNDDDDNDDDNAVL